MLALGFAAIVFAVLVPIIVPLLRVRGAGPEPASFDRAVYRDQLMELDRDVARGVITDQEATSARTEIQRRLLATANPAGRAVRTGASPIVAVVLGSVVAVGSVVLYATLGAPGVPDMPFAARPADPVNVLRQVAEANPNSAEAWLDYGRAAAEASQWAVAAGALKQAIDLGANDPTILSAYGEMLTLGARGTVVPAARAAFAAALAKDPTIAAARYYQALAAGQDGEAAKSIAMLQALLADLPGDAPERGEIGNRIAEMAKAAGTSPPPLAAGKAGKAGPGPDAAAVATAAQMSDEQRQSMIREMVARLAERMEANPDDSDGWLRLGRAYAVLNEMDKAAGAFRKAMALRPGDVGIPQQAVQALLGNQPPTAPVPPAAVALLRQVESLAPGQPAVLWYLGLAAAQAGQAAEAREDWGRLLAVLPPDGDQAKTIRAAIEALGNN